MVVSWWIVAFLQLSVDRDKAWLLRDIYQTNLLPCTGWWWQWFRVAPFTSSKYLPISQELKAHMCTYVMQGNVDCWPLQLAIKLLIYIHGYIIIVLIRWVVNLGTMWWTVIMPRILVIEQKAGILLTTTSTHVHWNVFVTSCKFVAFTSALTAKFHVASAVLMFSTHFTNSSILDS